MIWRAGKFEFIFPRRTLVMGIVNVTPDSFFDGGRFLATNDAVKHAHQLVAEGADILDIGGESTRPRAEAVSEAEELRRVIPVIQHLNEVSVPISVDTYKAGVARAAAEAGASIINDVGCDLDRCEMWRAVAEFRLGYVTMHMRGTPQTMQTRTDYRNIIAEVAEFFEERLTQLHRSGVSSEQVVLDPGIGFAKEPRHNLELLGRLQVFRKLQRPLVVGISRKSFIEKVPGCGARDRLAGSLAGAILAVQNGARIIRAHDVAATVQALRMVEAIFEASQQCSGES